MAAANGAPPPTSAPHKAEAGPKRAGSICMVVSGFLLRGGVSSGRYMYDKRTVGSGSGCRLYAKPDDVKRWKEDEREQGSNGQPAHDRVGHRTPEDRRRDRDHAEDCGRRGEQDWAEAVRGGFDHGIP